MTEVPHKNEDNAMDEVDSLFEERSDSRLVWIVPSVALHMVVFLVWFLMPEKERKEIKSRDMVIKSDQAEQLKQFVEDSNLRELRAEVRRLQDIKQAMASIRTEDMVELGKFEKGMRSSLVAEAKQALSGLMECHKSFAAKQEVFLQQILKISELYNTMQPLVEKMDVAAIAPYAQGILQAREVLYSCLEEMNEQFLQLPARQDSADSVLSWAKDEEVVGLWKKFKELQERMFALQGKCCEEQGDFPYKQDGALKKIVKDGPEFGQRLQKSTDDEKKAWLEYERRKKKYTEELEESRAAEQEFEKKLNELSEKIQKIKIDKDNLNKERAGIGFKTAEEKKKRDELSKRIKKLDKLYSATGGEKRGVDRKYRETKKKSSRAESELKRLKEPSTKWEKDRQRLKERMEKNLQALTDMAGNVSAQQEACALQQETIKTLDSLIESFKRKQEVPE